MWLVKAKYSILNNPDIVQMLNAIELAGRTCYKSESEITYETSKKFVKNLIARGHESVLEHQSISVGIICDRGISHEIVRHRIASYSQESTRFCNYEKNGAITYVDCCHHFKNLASWNVWNNALAVCENAYNELIALGESPQIARNVLPTSLKTEIVCTFNIREWRHFFLLRAAGIAGRPHPQMLDITIPMLKKFKINFPILFDDIVVLQN